MIDVPDEYKPILRRLAWDIVKHEALMEPGMQERFGLSPASTDVMEREHDEADDRLARVYPLYPQIMLEGVIAAQVAHTGILNSPNPSLAEDVDPGVLSLLVASSCFAVVMGLVDSGFLVPNFSEVHFDG